MNDFIDSIITAAQRQMVETVARAIYEASYTPPHPGPSNPGFTVLHVPSPGWAWDRTSEEMREFSRRQARAALKALNLLE